MLPVGKESWTGSDEIEGEEESIRRDYSLHLSVTPCPALLWLISRCGVHCCGAACMPGQDSARGRGDCRSRRSFGSRNCGYSGKLPISASSPLWPVVYFQGVTVLGPYTDFMRMKERAALSLLPTKVQISLVTTPVKTRKKF